MTDTDAEHAGERRAKVVAQAAALVAIAGGALVLVAWMFDIRPLKQPFQTVASMKANTALGLACAGFSLWCVVNGTRPGMAAAAGVAVSLLGLVTLSQDVFRWNLGIDELMFSDENPVATSSPGRMAPAAAFSFGALGLALGAQASGLSFWLSQAPALMALLVSSVAVFGYAYDMKALYGVDIFTSMAVHTASMLSLLAVGALCSRPADGVMGLIVSPELEGTAARRFLLAGVATPAVLGWLVLRGSRSGLYTPDFGEALMAVGSIAVLSTVILISVGSLRRLRMQSETALRAANDELQFRVERRTEELAYREKEFRQVIEEAHDAFIAMDAHGRIVGVNSKTEEMFGWPRGDLVGGHVSDTLMPARYRDAHRQGLEHFLNRGESRMLDRVVHIEALHRDGHEFPVELTVTAVWFDNQWRFNAFIKDLTESRDAQTRLRAALDEKEALLKEVHHRVKNNLQVISSFLRLQANGLTDRGAIEALRQSEDRVMSMAVLHENLYRSENLRRVDFDQYLNALMTHLGQAYRGKDGRVTINAECDLAELDIESAVPLGLLVNELVTNALKHAFPEGRAGHVSVHVSGGAEKGMLRVKDDGVGFGAGAESPSHSTGLAIIEALSRQLGGRGRFHQNGGTEFTLEFRPSGPGHRG